MVILLATKRQALLLRQEDGVKTNRFTPYDLRRSIATGARSTLGKEAAKLLLGHTKTDTTDIYLLEEVQETIKVAKLWHDNR